MLRSVYSKERVEHQAMQKEGTEVGSEASIPIEPELKEEARRRIKITVPPMISLS